MDQSTQTTSEYTVVDDPEYIMSVNCRKTWYIPGRKPLVYFVEPATKDTGNDKSTMTRHNAFNDELLQSMTDQFSRAERGI